MNVTAKHKEIAEKLARWPLSPLMSEDNEMWKKTIPHYEKILADAFPDESEVREKCKRVSQAFEYIQIENKGRITLALELAISEVEALFGFPTKRQCLWSDKRA